MTARDMEHEDDDQTNVKLVLCGPALDDDNNTHDT